VKEQNILNCPKCGEAIDGGERGSRQLEKLCVPLRRAALVVFSERECEFADGKPLPFQRHVVRIALTPAFQYCPVTVRGGNRIWRQEQKYR